MSRCSAAAGRGKLAQAELEVTTGTPADAARFARAEYKRCARAIRDAGIKAAQ